MCKCKQKYDYNYVKNLAMLYSEMECKNIVVYALSTGGYSFCVQGVLDVQPIEIIVYEGL